MKRYSCNNSGEIRYSAKTVMRRSDNERTNFEFFVLLTDENEQTL